MSSGVAASQWDTWLEHVTRLKESGHVADPWPQIKSQLDQFATHDLAIQQLGDQFMHALVTPRLVPHLMVSGSMAEGATTARWFQRTKDAKEIEIDIMYNGVCVPATEREEDLVEPAHNAPGYVHVFREAVYEKYAHPHLKHKLSHSRRYITGKYIDPSVIKMKTARFLGFKDDDNVLKQAMAVMFNTSSDQIIIEHNTQETATTAEVSIVVKKRDEILIKFSFDHVPCIKLLAWPTISHEWKSRDRKWPPQELADVIVQNGCHLVPKSSPGGDVHKEWRYSFSNAEIILSRNRSGQQKQAYALFKILFYRYLKGIKSDDPDGKGLFSYLGKSVMMWTCEKHAPTDPVWQDITASVDMLLETLQKHLQQRHLPNYFLVHINLMEGLAEDVVARAVTTIDDIRANVLLHVPVNFPEMVAQGNDVAARVRLMYNIASIIAQFKQFSEAAGVIGALGKIFKK